MSNFNPDELDWKNRYDKLDKEEKKKFARIVPDLILEVCSENDNFKDTYEKCKKWLSNGVKEVWCINPGKTIIILRKDTELHFKDDELANSEILTGFSIKPGDL